MKNWMIKKLNELATWFAHGLGAVLGIWVAAMALGWLGYWPCAGG